MASNKYYLGDLITQRREKNPGGDLPIRGVSKDGLQPPKQIDADTSIYNLYYRNDFVYNPARMELGSIAFNDEYDQAICSSLYEVFYVHRTDLVIPEYTVSTLPRMPSINDFVFFANVNALRYNQVKSIYITIESFILGEDAPRGQMIKLKEQEDIDALLNKFDNGKLDKLAGMTNIRFLTPDEITDGEFSNEKNQRNFAKQTAYYGADEVVNIIGVADIGDENLYCWPTVARYGDKWYLISVNSYACMMLGLATYNQAFVCGSGPLKDLIE